MKIFEKAKISVKYGYEVFYRESIVKISSDDPLLSGLDKTKKSEEDEDKLNYDFVKELERL